MKTFRNPSSAALLATLVLSLGLAGAQLALAADTPSPAVPTTTPLGSRAAAPADALAGARALIADNKWAAAIEELKRVDQPASADWNNLMGYSHRKARTPDFAAAERYYDAALKIEPQHRGALEYSGELFLMMGDLPRAEQRLAALDKACFMPCAEFTDLKKAVAAYKANGNRVVAKP